MGLTNPSLFRGSETYRPCGLWVGIFVVWTSGPGALGLVIRRLSNRCRDGSIILLHDGRANPKVLVDIVDTSFRFYVTEVLLLCGLMNPYPCLEGED